MEDLETVPRIRDSSFLALPQEIRLLIYEEYFGTWSCMIGSSGLHIFGPRGFTGLSTSLLSTCKRIYEEITAHQCFQKSFDGTVRYTRGCCLSRLQDLKHCWMLTNTNHVVSYFFDDTALRNWRPFQHFPNLRTLELEDTQYWSCGLSLHATVSEAARLFETKQIECQLLWCVDNLKKLREVIDRNGINIMVKTFLTIKDGPSCTALLTRTKVMLAPLYGLRLVEHKFTSPDHEAGFWSAVQYNHALPCLSYHQASQHVDDTHIRSCSCSFWTFSRDSYDCDYSLQQRFSRGQSITFGNAQASEQ